VSRRENMRAWKTWKNAPRGIWKAFTRRFADFEAQKSRFELLSNPFVAEVENALSNLQMELMELQCSDTLKATYESVGCSFHVYPRHDGPAASQAAHTSLCGSTYLCEQLFCLMKINNISHRTRLTDEHLHSILRVSSAQSLTPDMMNLYPRWDTKCLAQTSEHHRAANGALSIFIFYV